MYVVCVHCMCVSMCVNACACIQYAYVCVCVSVCFQSPVRVCCSQCCLNNSFPVILSFQLWSKPDNS